MNGEVFAYIKEKLQVTAVRFFVSSFSNVYLKNPVFDGHYSTFSDVLVDFTVHLPNLVNHLLRNYTNQLKTDAAFLAKDSVEQIELSLRKLLEWWIQTWFLDVNKADLQKEMDIVCEEEFLITFEKLDTAKQTAQEIIQSMLKQVITKMTKKFEERWEKQMKDPNAMAEFENGYAEMINNLVKQLTQKDASMQPSPIASCSSSTASRPLSMALSSGQFHDLPKLPSVPETIGRVLEKEEIEKSPSNEVETVLTDRVSDSAPLKDNMLSNPSVSAVIAPPPPPPATIILSCK